MGYTHLTAIERYQIFSLQKVNVPVEQIAKQLGRHSSTIYRELERNLVFDPRMTGYSPSRADALARYRKIVKPRYKVPAVTWDRVWERLHRNWSPEQISETLAIEGKGRVSHETIYRRIWADKQKGGLHWQHLRLRLTRGRRYRHYGKRGQIVGRIGIEHRATIVEKRSRRGDWEIDTVFGRRGESRDALVTMVDRRTKLLVIRKVASKHALGVARAIVDGLRQLRRPVHTITSDNGREFAMHAAIAANLKAKFYFARPYASWERGTNENTNGLLRQYFPKSRDFSSISQDEIEHAVNQLNHRPRKTLGFKTPHALFFA